MFSLVERRLSGLIDTAGRSLLTGNRIGIEKETLRVTPSGMIAQSDHPRTLGSALTHPFITTDYSEALLEFITPPCLGPQDALAFMDRIHRFVYSQLDAEMLWATSMPCVVDGEKSVPIARFGPSNPGIMKHVYRRGLAYRYGKLMQVIAGVHFNFSLTDDFWPVYQQIEQHGGDLQDFRSAGYFGLIRNLQRFGWLIPYLFGASPAVCKSFLAGRATPLAEFDRNTYYGPYATSLRMSGIGYQNKNRTGLQVDYDTLDGYIASLKQAIETPYPEYQKIGVEVDGEWRQLNANMLQIENEYYSTMRPKQPPQNNEKPILALARRGVQYVELRSLDVSPFDPLGVNAEQLCFLEAFLLFCLLHDSPAIDCDERGAIDANQSAAASEGRNPELQLNCRGQQKSLTGWAGEIVQAMTGLCEVLDQDHDDRPYSTSLARQQAKIENPEATPSAQVLADMRQAGEGFFHFAQRMSQQHQAGFAVRPLDADQQIFFETAAKQSLVEQQRIEAADQEPFGDYLARYFAQ